MQRQRAVGVRYRFDRFHFLHSGIAVLGPHPIGKAQFPMEWLIHREDFIDAVGREPAEVPIGKEGELR